MQKLTAVWYTPLPATRNRNNEVQAENGDQFILRNTFPALSETYQLFTEQADLASTLSESRLFNYRVGRQSRAKLEMKHPINITNYTLLSKDRMHAPKVSNGAF